MKPCTVCGIVKEYQDFYYRDKQLGKLHSQCKRCYIEKRKGTYKLHYHKYGSQYRERAVIRNRKQKNIRRAQILEYLSGKACLKCGNADLRVLEFDHIDPTAKSFSIAKGLTGVYSWERILDEIKKCQILCANCHKIRTAEQQGWYRNGKVFP